MEWASIKSNYDEDGKRKSCNDNRLCKWTLFNQKSL